MRHLWLPGLALILMLGFCLGPYALPPYHLQAGGQALEQTLGMTDLLEWCYIGPREVQDFEKPQKAIAH